MSRLLNGDQLADELDIPRSSLYYRIILWGYCFWVKLVSIIIPRIYFMDRFMINVSILTCCRSGFLLSN